MVQQGGDFPLTGDISPCCGEAEGSSGGGPGERRPLAPARGGTAAAESAPGGGAGLPGAAGTEAEGRGWKGCLPSARLRERGRATLVSGRRLPPNPPVGEQHPEPGEETIAQMLPPKAKTRGSREPPSPTAISPLPSHCAMLPSRVGKGLLAFSPHTGCSSMVEP